MSKFLSEDECTALMNEVERETQQEIDDNDGDIQALYSDLLDHVYDAPDRQTQKRMLRAIVISMVYGAATIHIVPDSDYPGCPMCDDKEELN